jgi:hypothetical protein
MMKYYGKEKCRILKQIRAEIARENDIEWVVSECKHKGNCKGTCPKCEQEVRQLEAALAKRESLGKKVAVVGISASIALSVTGCVNPFPQTTDGVPMGEPLPPETEDTTACDTAIQGIEVQTEMGELIVPGEPLPETTEQNTEEPLMGDVAIEGEIIEEITEEFGDELMGAPVEMPTETEEETDTEPVGEETTEFDPFDEDWDVTAGEPLPDDWTEQDDTSEAPNE